MRISARSLPAAAALIAAAALVGCGGSSEPADTTTTAGKPAPAADSPQKPAPQPKAEKPAGKPAPVNLPDGYKVKAHKGGSRQVFTTDGQPAGTADGKAVLVSHDGKLITPDGKPAELAGPMSAEVKAPKKPKDAPSQAPKGVEPAPKVTPSSPQAAAKASGMPVFWLGESFLSGKPTVSKVADGSGYMVSYSDQGSPVAAVVAQASSPAAKANIKGKPVSTPIGDGVVIAGSGGRPDSLVVFSGSGKDIVSVAVTVTGDTTVEQAAEALTRR